MLAYKPCELDALTAQLAQAQWRQLVLIQGSKQWCYQQLNSIEKQLKASWCILSTDNNLPSATWPEHTHQILGQEHHFAAYDAYSGFYADKFAALSGTVKAGGLLFLILPADTEHFIDPGINKLLSYDTQTPAQSNFWSWVENQLRDLDYSYIHQHKGTRLRCVTPRDFAQNDAFASQRQAIEAIVKTSKGRAKRPLLLCADRGRGKSAALGIAASQLPEKRIILCAIQRRAVQSTFAHLGMALQQENTQANYLANLEYMPPDKLLSQQQQCDVLFVDEAAAIPIPILIQLVERYPRVVFSSTLIGYEGSGRGYTLRFIDYLRNHYPNFKQVNLDTPIRFAANDPLEASVNQMLALDAQPLPPNELDESIQIARLNTRELLDSPSLLKQVFALLVLAHYQTSANDFRQLLDAPDQYLYVALQQAQPIAVCLVKLEGELEEDIARQCCAGQRRIQGHLLAQTLANNSNDPEYMCKRIARVSRIAVHPQLHSQGLGSRIISFIEDDLSQVGYDVLGTSFGAHATLVRFWLKSGYYPIKLGLKRDHVSGEHSIVMAKSLEKNHSSNIEQLSAAWYQGFDFEIPHFFSSLCPALIQQLLSYREKRDVPAELTTQLYRFIEKQISFQQVYAPLCQALDCHWPTSTHFSWQLFVKLRYGTYTALLDEYSKSALQQSIRDTVREYLLTLKEN